MILIKKGVSVCNLFFMQSFDTLSILVPFLDNECLYNKFLLLQQYHRVGVSDSEYISQMKDVSI